MQDLEYGKKTENDGKRETHTVGSEIWRETLKNVKMRNAYCRNWSMVRNLISWKMRNTHGRK